jgi:hypothetical protein
MTLGCAQSPDIEGPPTASSSDAFKMKTILYTTHSIVRYAETPHLRKHAAKLLSSK